MLFRTELKIDQTAFKIDHSMKIVSIGSCFANMIGHKFEASKFSINANPFGIIYNPISQCNLFDSLALVEEAENYFTRDEVTFNYHFHSDLFDTNIQELREKITQRTHSFYKTVEEADVLIFTFGTAFIYRLLSSNSVVANCHKAPSSLFKKDLLQEDMIVCTFKKLIQDIRTKNSAIKIILTVSPVRHIKDTIVLNSLSKAILRTACHKISEDLGDVFYFPSFELMMDDLRDYRFYKEDMIHPTGVAEDYIWSKFSECFFSEETKGVIKQWQKIRKAIDHTPFQPKSEAFGKFIKQTIEQTKKLERYFNVENEVNILQKKLFLNQ